MAAAPSKLKDGYYSSYCDLEVHQLMLEDRPRTTAYRQFFETHRDLIKGKVVMDVGAGTGILSLFAATAGAKKVYAVEASEVASLCQEIVSENGFESVIEVIHGAVEDIRLPDDVCVDVIVSEWMGFYLVHESMLDSVLIARDRFLSPDGIMAPSRACLYMAPVDMSQHFEDRADHWSNIYGYDFSPIASTINVQEVSKPLIAILPPAAIKSKATQLLDLDLKTMSVEEVMCFSKSCQFSMSEESRIHGFAVWFDVDFHPASHQLTKTDCCGPVNPSPTDSIDAGGDAKVQIHSSPGICDKREKKDPKNQNPCATAESNGSTSNCVRLSTSPFSLPTHWKQTVVFLPQTIMVVRDVSLCCRVKMAQDCTNKRLYNISIALQDGVCVDDIGDDDVREDVDKDNESDDSLDGDSDDSCDHPVPCDCGSNRCRLISALVDKYDAEHLELGEEAEMVETEAEIAAAKEINSVIEKEGWTLDTSDTDGVSALDTT